MNYVIQKIDDPRKFVRPPGEKYAYTTDINRAVKYASRKEAEGNCCGNERVVPMESVMEIC